MHQNSDSQEIELEIECPSFNTYTSPTTFSAAQKAAAESNYHQPASELDDFEFTSPATISGDTQLIFPVFNRDLLNNTNDAVSLRSNILVDYRDRSDDVVEFVRSPLRKLFLEEDRDSNYSSSESEAEELEVAPPGMYCVWPSPVKCEKSNSTGTSASGSVVKKWRLRDLMRRSKSDGKESLHFAEKTKMTMTTKKNSGTKADVRSRSGSGSSSSSNSSAHEKFYVKSRAAKDGERRKSYLPYRPELLVGFFGSNAGGGSHGGRAMPRLG